MSVQWFQGFSWIKETKASRSGGSEGENRSRRESQVVGIKDLKIPLASWLQARSKARLVKGNKTEILVLIGAFDVYLSFDLLHHVTLEVVGWMPSGEMAWMPCQWEVGQGSASRSLLREMKNS